MKHPQTSGQPESNGREATAREAYAISAVWRDCLAIPTRWAWTRRQQQETQIVQSQFDLCDLLPRFGALAVCATTNSAQLPLSARHSATV